MDTLTDNYSDVIDIKTCSFLDTQILYNDMIFKAGDIGHVNGGVECLE